jgi:hypothetical protein
MRLLQAVRNQAARIAAHVEDSKLFITNVDRGTFREGIISNFLRPFLPECYGLHAGEVFSADGAQSAQIDIVLYDRIFSTVLFRDEDTMLFPAESVFGSIEVKSHLNSKELRIAIENVASLKRLARTDSDMLDFLPFLRFNVGPEFGYDATKKNPYLGIIFGYDGISPEVVVGELNQRLMADPTRKQELPDFVFVTRPGYIVARMATKDGLTTVQAPGRDFAAFHHVMTGEDTLPLFFVGLNICLGLMRLRSFDFQSLWKDVFGQVLERSRNNP